MFEFPKQKALRFEFGTFEFVSNFACPPNKFFGRRGFRASDLNVHHPITVAVATSLLTDRNPYESLLVEGKTLEDGMES